MWTLLQKGNKCTCGQSSVTPCRYNTSPFVPTAHTATEPSYTSIWIDTSRNLTWGVTFIQGPVVVSLAFLQWKEKNVLSVFSNINVSYCDMIAQLCFLFPRVWSSRMQLLTRIWFPWGSMVTIPLLLSLTSLRRSSRGAGRKRKWASEASQA